MKIPVENTLREELEEAKQLDCAVVEAKRRMLKWPNPVEYVNNMYGCHPGDDGDEYFQAVYGGLDNNENE